MLFPDKKEMYESEEEGSTEKEKTTKTDKAITSTSSSANTSTSTPTITTTITTTTTTTTIRDPWTKKTKWILGENSEKIIEGDLMMMNSTMNPWTKKHCVLYPNEIQYCNMEKNKN